MMRDGLSCSALLVLLPLPVVCIKERTLPAAAKGALLERDKDSEGAAALKTFGSRGFIETSDGSPATAYRLTAQAAIELSSSLYRQVTG
jgi:hypothetical protein